MQGENTASGRHLRQQSLGLLRVEREGMLEVDALTHQMILVALAALAQACSTRTTPRKRGPWTPRMRVISISLVADGPEINVIGCVA